MLVTRTLAPRKYRSRLQIIADILGVVRYGSKKTHIMFRVNLSHNILSRYLYEMLKSDLACVNDSSEYVITDKGRIFLEKFTEYSEMRKQFKERFDHVLNEVLILESMCAY
mgnify:CR=1 FL=1